MSLSCVAPAPAKKEELRPLVSNNLGDGSEDEDLDFGGLDDNYDDEPLDSQQVFEKSGPLNFKKEEESKEEVKQPSKPDPVPEAAIPTDSAYDDDNWEDN